MKKKQIFFTKPHTAEFLECDVPEVKANEVLVKMDYTVISGGTERACIMGMPNTAQTFPSLSLGYCGVGYVKEIGKDVTSVAVGDRVLVYHGNHATYNIRTEAEITKVEDDSIDSLDASFVIIATMGLGGVRRLELEIGESAMVMGCGLLGIFAIQFCRMSGCNPVIAADLNEERRQLALKLGADYAFDPADPDFVEKVKAVTGGKGVDGIVEVTGVSAAMKQALECVAWYGRVSLLGCTRVSDTGIDYYNMVHRPAVKLIGAHNMARPHFESRPHCWTHQDDCKATLGLISAGKLQVKPIVSRIVSPESASEIYNQLCDDPHFPLGTVFDWRNI